MGGGKEDSVSVQRYKGLGEMNCESVVGNHHEPRDPDA